MVENNENFCFKYSWVFASELAAATLGLQMCNPRPVPRVIFEWKIYTDGFRIKLTDTQSVFYVNEQFIACLMAAY